MVTVTLPVTNESVEWGWAGWIHWETSGAHFYAWDRPLLFFSVDIYTCKAFLVEDALAFTRNYFAPTEAHPPRILSYAPIGLMQLQAGL